MKPIKSTHEVKNTTHYFQLDAFDKSILNILQQNAKTTIKDLSKKIHLSSTPIFERINKLEKLGIIKNYAAMLDYAKLNMQLMVICFVSLQQHDKKAGEKFIKQIQEIVEVVECLSISGNYDFMLKIIVENMDKYYQFHVNKLGKMDNIGQVQSSFVMGVVKQTGLILQ